MHTQGSFIQPERIKVNNLRENGQKYSSSSAKEPKLRETDITCFPSRGKPRLCIINIYININIGDIKTLRALGGEEGHQGVRKQETTGDGKNCQISNLLE